MVHLSNFLALALTAASMTSALQIKFRRFTEHGCDKKYHLHSDTHLDDGHCKTFTDHEVPFTSFKFTSEKGKHDLEKKDCTATVYAQRDCKGDGVTFGCTLQITLLAVFGLC